MLFSEYMLARKWRPQTFASVIGQAPVVNALRQLLSPGMRHPALLFSGTRGTGKTTLARLFAKGLNCQDPKPEPILFCNQCKTCMAVQNGSAVDVIELDAASHTRVEEIRELLESASYAPLQSRFKVFIIDEVHMLSKHSFNALLKTLEEPPGHVQFILATTDPQKLPETILSRLMHFKLQPVMPSNLVALLGEIAHQEKFTHSEEALRLLSQEAQGSVRDAVTLLQQAAAQGGGVISEEGVLTLLGQVPQALGEGLLAYLLQGELALALQEVQAIGMKDQSLDQLWTQLARLLQHWSVAVSLGRPPEFAHALQVLPAPPLTQLLAAYRCVLLGKKELRFAPSPIVSAEMTCLRLSQVFHNLPSRPTKPSIPLKASANQDCCQVLPRGSANTIEAGKDKSVSAHLENPPSMVSESAKESTASSLPQTPPKRTSKPRVPERAAIEPKAAASPSLPPHTHGDSSEGNFKSLQALVRETSNWAAEILDLKLSPLARLALLHAVLEAPQDHDRFHFLVLSNWAHLFSESALKQIQHALQRHQNLANPPKITFQTVDPLPSPTPYEIYAAAKAQQLAQAQAKVYESSFIQTLQKTMDVQLGRIEPVNSILPH